jgi:hypothetical protein
MKQARLELIVGTFVLFGLAAVAYLALRIGAAWLDRAYSVSRGLKVAAARNYGLVGQGLGGRRCSDTSESFVLFERHTIGVPMFL